MRFYDITIGSQNYTSLGADGLTNPAALNVEVDISVTTGDNVAGPAHVKIWGLGIDAISQANQLVGQSFSMLGGMAPGLPLANPGQAGLLAKGQVYKAWGNYTGVNQTLDLLVTYSSNTPTVPSAGNVPVTPNNLVLNWRKGTDLGQAVQQTLQLAYPGMPINVAVKSLQAKSDQVGYHSGLEQFAHFIRQYSIGLGGAGYGGVGIVLANGAISVADNSQPNPAAGTISVTDLIGQPTWIDIGKINFSVVMRADIEVNQTITLPTTIFASAGDASNGVGTAQSANQGLTFTGQFNVTSLRHLGNYRQPDAASWCTVIEAILPTP